MQCDEIRVLKYRNLCAILGRSLPLDKTGQDTRGHSMPVVGSYLVPVIKP